MRNIRLGSLLGIPILVNPSWFVLFALITWVFATDIYPAELKAAADSTLYAMAASSVILFFLSIILHELAHSVVARLYHIPVKSITLFIFGGVSQITREASKPLAELLMAVVGPLTSFVLSVLFLGAWLLAGHDQSHPVHVVLLELAVINAVLGVFNLIPAFPMDGGRVFRALIWLISGSYHGATTVAGWTGRGIAWAMMAFGGVTLLGIAGPLGGDQVGGVWLIFLENAARQGLLQNRLVQVLKRYRAGDLMTADPPVVEPNISVAALARGVLELNPRVCYFVEESGRLAGILSAYQMRAVPEALWDSTTAGEAMVPRERLSATAPESTASEVLLQMETENLTHMPVVREGRVIGVIGRDRIISALRQAGLLGPAPA
jgi:Zn-dependent protease